VTGRDPRAARADEVHLLAAAVRPVGPDGGGASGPAWNRRAWDGPAAAGALRLAVAHDLLPALWRAEVDRGTWMPLPDEALDLVSTRFAAGSTQPALLAQRAHRANQERVADLVDQAEIVLRALAEAGIEVVPLKGLHGLRAGWWPDPATRVMRDLDLLVSPADAEQAERVLDGLGYVELASGHDAYGDHERPARHRPDRAGSVELHTALVVSRWRAVLPAAEVLGAGAPLSTTDAVVHGIAHAQLHDEAHLLGRLPLRAVHELACLVAGPRAEDIDWRRVRQHFAAAGAEVALDAHLALVRSLFAAPVPAPEHRGRAELHRRWCLQLLAHPARADGYERLVFVPRALSPERMRRLHGDAPMWRLRTRHLVDASVRAAGRGGA
jgi:hypothetical protein